ncbi:MAG TPA: hypothetical protein DDX71_04805 [Ruminococcus sp.]|nr:hypothetical protein [Ruminococcus sp.]
MPHSAKREAKLRSYSILFGEGSRQTVRRLTVFLIGAILLMTAISLEPYGVFVPRDVCRPTACTLESFSYTTGRAPEIRSIFTDAAGQHYQLPATLSDAIGRECVLNVHTAMTGKAYRMGFELPRLTVFGIIAAVSFPAMLALVIWYWVTLHQWKKYKDIH